MNRGTRHVCTALITVSLVCALPGVAAAQNLGTPSAANTIATTLSEAEAAFAAGDPVAAERRYAALLAIDPAHPRALFRLAQLRRTDPDAATPLLQQYVQIVPSDAWGHLALADAFARGGDAARSLEAYAQALLHEPDDRDIRLGGPRLLTRLGRTDAAIDAYEEWLADNPADGEAWRELATARQRAGRLRAATGALERARELAPDEGDLTREIDLLRVRTAPAAEVGFMGAGETGASTTAVSLGLDVTGADAARVGMYYQRRRVASFDDVANTHRVGVRARARPRSDLHLDLSGGVMWAGQQSGSGAQPDVAFRVRKASPGAGLILSVRAQRDPVDVTPELARSPVSRSQVITSLDAPVRGPWRIRGQARAAALTRENERNTRTGLGGGVGVAVAPEMRLVGQWHQTWNSNPAARGYFAPERAQVAEMGLELDREYANVAISLDAGGGLQRFQRFNQTLGPWSPALRLWGLVAWNMGVRRQLLVEFDTYDSQVTDAIIVSERWRYGSISASLRVALR